MAYALTSLTGKDVVIEPAINVTAESGATVSYYTSQIKEAVDAGLISVAITVDSPVLTDSSTGTATEGAIAAITDIATAANAVATLALAVNQIAQKVDDVMVRAAKLM